MGLYVNFTKFYRALYWDHGEGSAKEFLIPGVPNQVSRCSKSSCHTWGAKGR